MGNPWGQLLRSAPAVLCLFFLSRFLVICVTCTTWFTPKWMQTIVVIMKVSENIMLRMSINVRTCGSGDCGMRVRARSMRTPKAAELLIAAFYDLRRRPRSKWLLSYVYFGSVAFLEIIGVISSYSQGPIWWTPRWRVHLPSWRRNLPKRFSWIRKYKNSQY